MMEAQRPEGMTTSKNRGRRFKGFDDRLVLTKAHCWSRAAPCSHSCLTFTFSSSKDRSGHLSLLGGRGGGKLSQLIIGRFYKITPCKISF